MRDLVRLEESVDALDSGSLPEPGAVRFGGLPKHDAERFSWRSVSLERLEAAAENARFALPEDFEAQTGMEPDAFVDDGHEEAAVEETWRPGPPDEAWELAPVRVGGRGALASLREPTDLSNCLTPLLEAVGWPGDPRHVAEALPHFPDQLDVMGFRNVLATLQIETRPFETDLKAADARLLPCLFVPEDGPAKVLLDEKDGRIRAYCGGKNAEIEIDRTRVSGTVFVAKLVRDDTETAVHPDEPWFNRVVSRFRGLFHQTLATSLGVNLFALSAPLFVMAVYDRVIGTGSLPTLVYFGIGAAIVILADWILRAVRARMLALTGARLGNLAGTGIFHRILYLPPSFIEKMSLGAQVTRIKDFETIQDFFAGPPALVLLEIPFVLIFIAAIAIIGGPVAFIPVIMVVLFVLLAAAAGPVLKEQAGAAARASARKQAMMIETLQNMRAIKCAGAEEIFHQRFRDVSSEAADANLKSDRLSALVQAIGHVMMIGSGVAAIVFGAVRVMNGDMTIGGLMAAAILVWSAVTPLQTAFLSLTCVCRVRGSITQMNGLMNVRPERQPHTLAQPLREFEGYMDFDRVSIRYASDADPALDGVGFHIEPGEVVAIAGDDGAGKSTALKLMAGLHMPQAGNIRIDGTDIRQLDPVELRHAVAYVPQVRQFFDGTIAQNLRLAEPTAGIEELRYACEMAGCLEDVEALEQGAGKWRRAGFDVRIGGDTANQTPVSLLQRLNLARGYLKNARILLLDEPGNGLDLPGDQAFCKAVEELRGRATVIVATHRPGHIRLADKVIWLEKGVLRAAGPAETVMRRMPGGSIQGEWE